MRYCLWRVFEGGEEVVVCSTVASIAMGRANQQFILNVNKGVLENAPGFHMANLPIWQIRILQATSIAITDTNRMRRCSMTRGDGIGGRGQQARAPATRSLRIETAETECLLMEFLRSQPTPIRRTTAQNLTGKNSHRFLCDGGYRQSEHAQRSFL